MSLLHSVLAPTLYFAVLVTFFLAVTKRAEWALYLLVILIPLPDIWYQLQPLPFGKDTMDILVLGAFLGVLLNKGGMERAPNTKPIIQFIVISYLALWNTSLRFDLPLPFTTANPHLADWKNYIEMMFLYFLAYNAIRNEDGQKKVTILMAAVILVISIQEARNFYVGSAFSYDKRALGYFSAAGLNANHFGAFVADFGCLLLGLYLIDRENKFRKWLYLSAAALSTYPLFYSYSRGAYLGVLAALAIYGLLKARYLLVLLAALVVAWQTVLPATVVERIAMTDTNGVIEESAAERLDLWEHAKRLFEEHPVFGIGFEGFGHTRPAGSLTDTHNFYMKTASEQGLIGLIILAVIMLHALGSGARLYRIGRSPFQRALGLGFLGCVVSVIVTNVFGDRWSYFALGGYFWILWGLADRAIAIAQEQEADSSDQAESPQPATN